ncbi:hypothetical protein ATCC51562_126 [Campylobacter concisus ATCC 51562]|uniref:Uncharacterized protein n=1 Tax=Campylobacter concisus ATCC 51562 TaxID=1242969 RepID=U2F7C4_9BACT|nr:hypothetical protein ATCC51562_126 [Campylobacter concisus ATCC 51562]
MAKNLLTASFAYVCILFTSFWTFEAEMRSNLYGSLNSDLFSFSQTLPFLKALFSAYKNTLMAY